MFENPRRGRQAKNFTANVPKILDLKSSSEQIFSENWRWVPLVVHTHRAKCRAEQLALRVWFFKSNPDTWIFTSFVVGPVLFPTYSPSPLCEYLFMLRHQSVAPTLSDMWRSTFEIGVAQLRSVTEIAPKLPFLCVNRSPIQYCFRAGAKAIWDSEKKVSVDYSQFPIE